MSNFKNGISWIAAMGCLTIMACGGGGGGNDSVVQLDETAIVGPDDHQALQGESVGLALLAEDSDLSDILWQQTAGPAVSFLGANRKVIGFDLKETGSYSFKVSFQNAAGTRYTADYSLSVTADSPVYVNARLDHEANARAKMTLYADEQLPGSLLSVNWTQLSGPQVSLESSNSLGIFFTAPQVNQDEVLRFQVTVVDDQGHEASDEVLLLVEPETIDPDSHFNEGRFAENSLADVYPYIHNSSQAGDLSYCIYSNTTTDYCNLGRLSFIGSDRPVPSIDDIMARVLVSHDWMGQRFREFLQQVDSNGDIRQLLGAVRSIVIAYDIRPSFFWSGTGAIYIDPTYLWLTPEERDTIDNTPDFRSDFDQELQFRDPWRVVKNNDYAFYVPPRELRQTRSMADLAVYSARLFYHELAHANDYFPPRVWASAGISDYPWTYTDQVGPDSNGLQSAFPLTSSAWFDLASVMFHGESATSVQKAYTPADAAALFFVDNATNTYNYSTPREDYAMLAEEYLMSYRFGVQYDQGITDLAPDYWVATAERGRVSHDRIRPRAEYVVSRILPSLDLNLASSSLLEPVTLSSGVTWWDSIVAPGQTPGQQKAGRKKPPVSLGFERHGEGPAWP